MTAEFASVGSRFGALILDGICGAVVSAVGYAAVFALENTAGLAILGLVELGFIVLMLVMAANGSSPGKAMLGIRVVRASTGERPGFGLGLGRLILRSILLGITVYIAGFSPFWDSSRRNRAWWDAAVDTVVLAKGSSGDADGLGSRPGAAPSEFDGGGGQVGAGSGRRGLGRPAGPRPTGSPGAASRTGVDPGSGRGPLGRTGVDVGCHHSHTGPSPGASCRGGTHSPGGAGPARTGDEAVAARPRQR